MVLPIPSGLTHRFAGVVVAGVSPSLELDASYQSFLELVTAQLGTAIASAGAYADERRRAQALAELDAAKTTFFSNVSHEFRTPLTLMLGPLEDALRDAEDPLSRRHRERASTVHRNALRLLKLVNSLLEFSRIEAGRVQASFEPTDLAALTAGVASSFRSLTERAGLQLVVDCPPVAEPVFVDRRLWEQIVLNLVSNAFKFTLEGAILVRIEQHERSVRLLVRDTGTGIDAIHLPHLFERFYRVEGARGRTYEGSGIGLALVRELARLHGGSVTVESEPGKGTTFTVTVPLGTDHLARDRIQLRRAPVSASLGSAGYVEEAASWLEGAAQLGSYEPVPIQRGDSDAAGTAHLLVADDNADMRSYLERLLRPLGTVETVADGNQALAAIRRRLPDLVLSDIMMPNLDGFGLVRALREDARTRTLPVVLLSARAGEEARVEGLGSGADDYVVKPFSARELTARVGAQLQLARLRREHAEAIRKDEERFRALVTASSDVVYRMSPDWSEMLHLRGRDFVANTDEPSRSWLQKYIHPDDQPRVMSAIEEAIRTKSLFELEHRVLRVDGTLGWTFSRAVPLTDARGEIVEWVGAASDITARKSAVERLAADNTALTRMHALSGRVVEGVGIDPLLQETMDTAVAILGAAKGTLQLVEGDALRIVAHCGHQAPFLDFFAAAEDVASACGSAMRVGERVLVPDVETSPIFLGTTSLPVLRAAGVRAVQSTPMRTRAGRMLGILTTHWTRPHTPGEQDLRRLDLLVRQAADLIELKQAQEQVLESAHALEIANAGLREADRRKDEFLAMLGHELRNPLAPIRNAAYILERADPNGEQAERARGILRRQSEHLTRLVDDLLDVTRITRGKIALRRARVSLRDLLVRAAEDIRPSMTDKGVALRVEVPASEAWTHADATRLSQVVANLLHNAYKFTQRGDEVSVSLCPEENAAEIRVRDTGAGIDPAILPHIFEPFVQADQTIARSEGGLGLGLALVKGIVELHGGEVRAESAGIRKGTEFVVRLPLRETALAEIRRGPGSATPVKSRRRVLVVDDNKDAAESLAELLRMDELDVDVAHDGPTALERFEARRPDVVLCDLGLSGMDGYEIARAMKADGKRSVKLIALSGYTQPDDVRRAQEAGFDAHVAKPPDPEELARLLA